ncbi:LacI family DNA-binding transcriptional regulator [Opitutus terrae]|uniref:Transcriptional regulator, LacI family n=1 Tax=Opitutus terrae (strain DSM 11246 / JCM 15787 / PB90-1) TaxID=452637 RepID=B1ZU89_OPITP|nr:LacI family DNA-binding transcriptional regulator [Opitutus terrae]ACB76651.1 transcriptional regulator, LacI family [Opitutus terrae PB90-1]
MRDAPSCKPVGNVPDSSRPPATTADSAPAESATATPHPRRVTQLDVARAAGVHNTTVSLALRNSPAIPEPTRRRIQSIAEQMGYSPDPALRALVAYRNGLAANRRTESIAYVTDSATRWGWRDLPAEEQYFAGAQRKAAACGYQLEHFWLGEPGMSAQRLSSVLFYRGITGLLLASQRCTRADALDFDWTRLSAVKIGWLPHTPVLHRVTNDCTGDLRLAIRQVLAAGYRRPGLVLPSAWDEADDQAWSVAFLTERARLAESQRVPILFQEPGIANSSESALPDGCAIDDVSVSRWFDEFRPDVILGPAALLPVLQERRIHLGKGVGFVGLFQQEPAAAIASVRQSSARVGEVAAELLIGQLQQNLRGLPEIPTTTLVQGVWCDGASLPRRRISTWPERVRRFAEEHRKTASAA